MDKGWGRWDLVETQGAQAPVITTRSKWRRQNYKDIVRKISGKIDIERIYIKQPVKFTFHVTYCRCCVYLLFEALTHFNRYFILFLNLPIKPCCFESVVSELSPGEVLE